MTIEQKLLADIEQLQKNLEKAEKRAEENEGYRNLIENRVNRNAKDSVFVNLFSFPENQMRLYKELFPDDTTITQEDLELYKVDRILTNHPYNDLGLLARKKLIVLAEAESDWSVNIIYRLAGYYFDSMEQFATQTGMNPHQKAKIDLLDVEAFVIYPGKEKVPDTISLREVFFGGNESKPEFIAKVIHGDRKPGILQEYMGFCRILDEQRALHRNDLTPEKWIEETVEESIKSGFLVEYLSAHKAEVQMIMFEMYNPKYEEEMERKYKTYMDQIIALRAAKVPDDKIKETLVSLHGITPTYAQNLLDVKPSEHVVEAV